MADAGCINAYNLHGCFLQTIDTLNSEDIGQDVCYYVPRVGNREVEYICYIDKCGCCCRLDNENELIIHTTQGILNEVILEQNDEDETVNVKWSELFGNNWKKTVVRYKTGGYPVSEVDGTLAVEELVQNQYAISGYDISGLESGEIYYFRVFAIAQDDSVIMVQSGSITPEFGRHPGRNTLLYLPLESDVVDMSGKTPTRVFSTNGLSFTTIDGVQSVHIGSTGGIKLTTPYPLVPKTDTYPCTVSIFVYITNTSTDRIILDMAATNGNRQGLGFNTSNKLYMSVYNDINDSNYVKLETTLIPSQWNNIIYTITTTSSKLYVNGVLVASGVGNPNYPRGNWPYSHDNTQGIFCTRDVNNYGRGLNGNARELIMEKVEWTAKQAQDYYNKMKAEFQEKREDFQEVQYIQSSGTQYIDTGVMAENKYIIDAKFLMTDLRGTSDDCAVLGGSGSSRPSYMQYILKRGWSGHGWAQFVGSNYNQMWTSPYPSTNVEYVAQAKLSTSENYLTINGTKYTWSYTSAYNTGYTLYMFGANNAGTFGNNFYGRIYYLSIKDLSNNLVRDFVPCYRKSDGVIGMFDKANNKFYTNKGSGTFTKGPNVN